MLKVGDKNTILGLDCDSSSGCKIDLLWFWGGEVEEIYFFRDLPFNIHLFQFHRLYSNMVPEIIILKPWDWHAYFLIFLLFKTGEVAHWGQMHQITNSHSLTHSHTSYERKRK